MFNGVDFRAAWTTSVNPPGTELNVALPDELTHLKGPFKCLLWGGDEEYRKALGHSLLLQSSGTYDTLKPSAHPLSIRLSVLGDGAYFLDKAVWAGLLAEHANELQAALELGQGTQVWSISTLEGIPPSAFDIVFKVGDWPLSERLERAQMDWKTPVDAWRVAQHTFSPQSYNKVILYCERKQAFDWQTAQKYFLQQDEMQRAIKKEESLLERVSPASVEFVGDDATHKWLKDLINMLNHPEKTAAFGVKQAGGFLLYGAPGAGKTHFVRQLSQKTDMAIYAANSSQMAQGGAEVVRKVFGQARKLAPCILFIDEVDVLCSNPHEVLGVNNKKQELVNAFLAEMDGIHARDGLWVIGATHRPIQYLDPATVRAGRFSEQVHVPLPAIETREKLWSAHLYGKPVGSVDVKSLAFSSAGFSGAEIQRAVEIAALTASKEGIEKINQEALALACDELTWGGLKDLKQQADEIKRVAIHEAGHALMCLLLEHEVLRVTIRPRQRGSLGAVQHNTRKQESLLSKEKLENQVKISLAGVIAEETVLGSFENGGGADFRSVGEYLHMAIWDWGFSHELGFAAISFKEASEELKREVEQVKIKWLNHLAEETRQMLSSEKATLCALAGVLEAKRDVSNSEINEWWQAMKPVHKD
jgi:cell division protease FtsH